MTLFVSQLFQGRSLSRLQRQLFVAIVTNLALWDPLLAERLVDAELDVILNPLHLLQTFATELGWSASDGQIGSDAWYRGFANDFEDIPTCHSSILALNDPDNELVRRIWSAEVAVLLPFIEERRRDLIRDLKDLLWVPFCPNGGAKTVTERRDLEIGHIEFQLSRNPQLHDDLYQRVRRLKAIRNNLAHLEQVAPNLLLDDRFAEIAAIPAYGN